MWILNKRRKRTQLNGGRSLSDPKAPEYLLICIAPLTHKTEGEKETTARKKKRGGLLSCFLVSRFFHLLFKLLYHRIAQSC